MAGERMGSVGWSLTREALTISYARTDDEGEPREYHDRLQITTTDAGFGGLRQWVVCPCGRRCRVVYVGARGTRCRQCYRLAYQSQREDVATRAQRRAAQLARSVGAGVDAPFDWWPPKPKRMHWNTYWRLGEKHWRLVELEDAARFAYASQLVASRRWLAN